MSTHVFHVFEPDTDGWHGPHRCKHDGLLAENARHRADLLGHLVDKVMIAAMGDSNDAEIEAYRDALDEALSQLGREDLRIHL